MYNVAPGARAAWDALFAWLAGAAGVALEAIAHAPPASLPALWGREDLGAAVMCGFPYASLAPAERPAALAALRPSGAFADGGANYASHIVVRADAPFTTFDDLKGRRFGWTVRDSQSGYHAPRQHVAARWGAMLFAEARGPLLNPSGVLAALEAGEIDAGPVDAQSFALLALHEPALAAGLRVLDTTAARPAPLLVAAPTLPPETLGALRGALLSADASPEARPLLRALALDGFAAPDPARYGGLVALARQAGPPALPAW
ncbi:phosphate ABC transporter substrate-binding protein [Aureimonas flava]|uniref:Phosphate ABC transporter substrate-binding protein n=2 Tax=Aureimonas flava TaxID=2320271 RepID=A0A3A1WMU9_9HYPH|nr:phosphate ABC transporter substrate-binding protein [Aureimonas flava]